MRRLSWIRGVAVMVVVSGGVCGVAVGQTTATPRPNSSALPPGMTDPRGEEHGLSASTQEKLSVARNDERMRKIQADTTQLLALATKLKEDVDKTDKYTLSLDVVKRTEQIERLAKAIKERERQ